MVVKLKRKQLLWTILLVPLVGLLMPVSIPKYPTSTVIFDREGDLLGASIATDGQWRFPLTDSVPSKLAQSIVLFEDEYFYWHIGINPISVARAFGQNLAANKIISGASTLTMQLSRMLYGEQRTLAQKIKEAVHALRLDLYYSKEELLRHYASLAPFGGNVVGIDAAAWRYYGRPAHQLSWSESATLAVLPNNPSGIFPGKASDRLLAKRNFLLRKLLAHEIIDSLEYQLSVSESLPLKPQNLPRHAPHLLSTLAKEKEGQQMTTTLSPFWQTKANETASRYHNSFRSNGVDNLSILVVDLKSADVLAYVGNTDDRSSDSYQVDVIRRPRSSGSILKPLLYVDALDAGLILPESLLPDVPSYFNGYSPKNFDHGYEGVIKASEALARSLNIPFVHLIKSYGYERFHQQLQNKRITTINNAPGHYGMTLILGGAEVKLWELAQVYFSLYRRLAMQDNLEIGNFPNHKILPDLDNEEINVFHTFQAMTDLKRAGRNQYWQNFSSSQKIAWKTGTSFGFKDAWAIGLNGSVLVAVWVGNADGEGRAGLTGAGSAGPILNDLIRLSNYQSGWLADLEPMGRVHTVCEKSGMLANDHCPETEQMSLGKNAEKSGLCTYHQRFFLDQQGVYEVSKSCYPANEMQDTSLFIMPPSMATYYAKRNASYTGRPTMHPLCLQSREHQLEVTYPAENAQIFIPKELSGSMSELILEAAHTQTNTKIYWHLNAAYLGSTEGQHRMPVSVNKGTYTLKIVDELGNDFTRNFEVISNP
ncbi:MAG: penicillin-binding protein 1C [Cyclobacteriaceae bacterium]